MCTSFEQIVDGKKGMEFCSNYYHLEMRRKEKSITVTAQGIFIWSHLTKNLPQRFC